MDTLATINSRIADRLWELHARDLQNMSEDELSCFTAGQLAPLDPTISDLQGVIQRLHDLQRDNARPPDGKQRTEDPADRYFS